MAGTDIGFDENAFKTAVRFAMRMGSPNRVAEKVTFRWNKAQTFGPQDPARKPYHWNEVPLTDTSVPDIVLEEVAVDYKHGVEQSNALGTFAPLTAELTMLGEDHDKVLGADQILIGGDIYDVVLTTVEALFSVDVYTIHVKR